MPPDRKAFARRCEDLAEDYLRRRGYDILLRNFLTRRGEIDIVARRNGVLVFVEVKGKRSGALGFPQEMVGRQKKERLVAAALAYLDSGRGRGMSCRFDVISVMAPPGEAPRLDHLEGAFGLDGL